jgi:hypothetical protein
MNLAGKTDQEAGHPLTEVYLGDLKVFLILRHEEVGHLEHTSGNYDDAGRLIERRIPTITTELCEIGIHGDVLYLVVILPSNAFSKDIFDAIRNQDIKIYSLKNFKTTLFEKGDTASYEGVRSSLHDEFVQIQFDFPWQKMNVGAVGEKYLQIKESFGSTKVVNQLVTRLDGKTAGNISDSDVITVNPTPKPAQPPRDKF